MSDHLHKLRPIHPFPARMAPSIALDELPEADGKPLRVLDPMSGSGTTMVIARSRGHRAVGFDTDPLALVIGNAWCSDFDRALIATAGERVFKKADEAWRMIRQADAYPEGAGDETKEFVRYWFDLTNRRQLRALADAIKVEDDRDLRRILWCGFSKLIIAKSRGASFAMDLSHSRPHRVLGREPFRPLPNFLRSLESMIKNAPFQSDHKHPPKARIECGDARSLPLQNKSVDIVITSPPYLNAIDYLRCNKFSLIWMGHEIPKLRRLRSDNIGSEVSTGSDASEQKTASILGVMGNVETLSNKTQGMLARYVNDMDAVIGEIARVMKPTGRAILVIGDCTMRGVFVSNSRAFIKLGERHDLKTVQVKSRPLPDSRRYLPPPAHANAGAGFQSRMREEIVITLAAA